MASPYAEEHLLVSSLQKGDEDAFAGLYDRFAGMMLGVIRRYVSGLEDSENLLQDCFIKIWKNIGQYDSSRGRLGTWLVNIARNAAIDFTRSRHFQHQSKNQNLEEFVYRETGVDSFNMKVDGIGLKNLLDRLTPQNRQVIELLYFDGYTQQEVADEFGIPLGTVKSRTRLAIKELRGYFN